MKSVIDNVLTVLNTNISVFDIDVTLLSVICFCCVASILIKFIYGLFD